MDDYMQFLASKAVKSPMRGLTRTPELADHLFPFQRLATEFALRVGSAGIFLDTGLGKTEIQLEWCQRAIEAMNGTALILTPLAVAGQTKRRAEKWGYEARVIRDQSEARHGVINICNYDRLDKLDTSSFQIVSLDEASILKSFSGKTRNALVQAFKGAQFKLPATATPAPNDHMEFGSYAEFLEVMASNEMLSRFFINDTSTASQQWRLKGHAIGAFWDWMTSWSRMAEKPSDLTGNTSDDAAYNLPPFEIVRHRAHDSQLQNEFAGLFGADAMSATDMHEVKRQTIEARAEKAAEAVNAESGEPWLIWCNTNYEADVLKAVLPNAIEVRGSQSADEKEELLEAFGTGQAKHIITKPELAGFGLDWSHCARMAFVGRTFSYETWYQAVRRCWRFGQTRNLKVHLVVAEGEDAIGRVIDRKESDHAKMKTAMRDAMRRAVCQSAEVKTPYQPKHKARLAPWLKSAA